MPTILPRVSVVFPRSALLFGVYFVVRFEPESHSRKKKVHVPKISCIICKKKKKKRLSCHPFMAQDGCISIWRLFYSTVNQHNALGEILLKFSSVV